MASTPYADAARDYWAKGHQGVLPLPEGEKWWPPTGYTGWNGQWPSRADIESWILDQPGGNVALRLPEDVLGIDCDDYGSKRGDETLADIEDEIGLLPATISSTSRGEGPSRILFYKVPPGLSWRDDLKDVELIHHGHRYAVVWPSIHPDTGRTYRWYGKDGRPIRGVPSFDDLADLPLKWEERLSNGVGGSEKVEADDEKVEQWLAGLNDAPPCTRVAAKRDEGLGDLSRPSRSRHNTFRDYQASLVGYGASGCPGVREALQAVETAFYESVAGDRKPGAAKAEWRRALTGAVRMSMKDNPQPRRADPCARDADQYLSTDDDDGGLVFVKMSQVRAREVDWLVDGFLANGHTTMLAGDPGVGKTFLWMSWACEITNMGRDVVAISNENHIETVLKQRWEAFDSGPGELHMLADSDASRFTISEDGARMIRPLMAKPEVAALFIDPYDDYSGGADTFRGNAVRGSLRPFKTLAQELDFALAFATHLTKGSGLTFQERVSGSHQFTGIVDIGLGAGVVEATAQRGLIRFKNRLGAEEYKPSWEYRLSPEHGFEWVGPGNFTESHLLKKGDEDGVVECTDYLRELLADGEQHRLSDLEADLKSEGFSYRSIRAAKKRLTENGDMRFDGRDGPGGPWLVSLGSQAWVDQVADDAA